VRHCRMGTGECAPLTVGVAEVGDRVGAAVVGTAVVGTDVVGTAVGAVAQAQSLLLLTIDLRALEYPVGSSQPPSEEPLRAA
jgi:hypothetical protein